MPRTIRNHHANPQYLANSRFFWPLIFRNFSVLKPVCLNLSQILWTVRKPVSKSGIVCFLHQFRIPTAESTHHTAPTPICFEIRSDLTGKSGTFPTQQGLCASRVVWCGLVTRPSPETPLDFVEKNYRIPWNREDCSKSDRFWCVQSLNTWLTPDFPTEANSWIYMGFECFCKEK